MYKSLLALFLLIAAHAPLYAQADPEAQLANAYFEEQDWERALKLYDKLHTREPAADVYVLRGTECFTRLKRPADALAFVSRAQRRAPQQKMYPALRGYLLHTSGKSAEAEKTWAELVEKQLTEGEDFTRIGAFFLQNNLDEWAARTYLRARKVLRYETLFAQELATVYQRQKNAEAATAELLNMYFENPQQLGLVNGSIQRIMGPDANNAIEKALLLAAQRHESDLGLREVTYNFYLLSENYSEALVQVRAIDRLMKDQGQRLYQFALTLQNNAQYELSNRALGYIVDEKKNSPYYFQSLFQRARNFELKALAARPLDSTAIRQAIANYDLLFQRYGRGNAFIEAMLRKAQLQVFYLNDLPAALQELAAIEALNVSESQKAEARLLVGDIFLLQGEYNKAKLKYTEVETALKDEQQGAAAKFRQARLAYFKGDFEFAQARLSTLKENAQDDIANDAIRLYLLIQDNTGLDTSTTALQQFAHAQLCVYQKQTTTAMVLFDSLLFRYPNHPLVDEVLWEKATIYLQQQKPEEALVYIDRILDKYPDDLWGDDALFTKAEIYQYTLNNPAQAQELYLKLLTQYSGSLYKVEARKRIRQLRGEKVQ